jgi:hypothetical protein
MRNPYPPPRPRHLCRIAALLSVAAFGVLLVDTLAPNTITAPRISGAPIATTLAD